MVANLWREMDMFNKQVANRIEYSFKNSKTCKQLFKGGYQVAEDKEADVEQIEGALEGHRVGKQTNLQLEG